MKRFSQCLCLALLLVAASAYAEEHINLDTLVFKNKLMVTCDFEEAPLSEVLSFLGSTYELNLVIDVPAGTLDETLVTIKLDEVTVEDFLRSVLYRARLEYAFKRNIIYVATPSRITRYQHYVRRHYNIRDLSMPLAASNGYDDRRDRGNGRRGSGNRRRGRNGGQSADDVMGFIERFTGSDNWDSVGSSSERSSRRDGRSGRSGRRSGRRRR